MSHEFCKNTRRLMQYIDTYQNSCHFIWIFLWQPKKKTEISPTLLVSDTFVLIAICAYFKNKTFLYIDWPLVRWTLDDPLRWKRQCETIFLSRKKITRETFRTSFRKENFPPSVDFQIRWRIWNPPKQI